MAKVLIINGDSAEQNRLTAICRSEYEVISAFDGDKGWESLLTSFSEIVAVLLRMEIPGMNGREILDRLVEKDLLRKLPVIVIEGENDPETDDSIFAMGVAGFIRAPFHDRDILRYLKNERREREYRQAILKKLGQQNEMTKKQYLLLQKQAEEIRANRLHLVEALGTVVEYRNLENGDHVRNVRIFSEILGTQMMKDFPEYHLTEELIDRIGFASLLHDIGKISIPDSIMLKPGKLTEDELEIMRSHTTKGCEILEQVDEAWPPEYQELAMEICRYHHERYDGKGYPDGLEGEDIPISAQLVSLADAYDALTSERVYKRAYSKDRAFEMLINGECGEFNPKLMDSFRRCRAAFEAQVVSNPEIEHSGDMAVAGEG